MAQAIEVITTFQDQANKTAKNSIFINSGLTIAQYNARLQQAAIIIDAATQAVIKSMIYCVSVDISTLTDNTISLDSDVEEVGAFKIATAAGRIVDMNIPGILPGMNIPGTDDLDLDGVEALQEIHQMIFEGLDVEGLMGPCDIDGEDATQVVSARYEVRNSGSSDS